MKQLLLTLAFLVVLKSCKSADDTEVVMNDEFYKSYYLNNILPSLQNFKQHLEELKQFALDFKTSNSDANYQKVVIQWLVSAKAYSRAEVYNFGLIKERFFYLNIYNYPINTTQIENNIAEKANYNTTYFSSESTVNKGLAALEYLLYADFNTEDAKTALLNNAFRLNYFLGVIDELLRQANALINTWQNEYFDTYINADQSICSNNAKCLIINQIINVLDVAKVTKIGKPAGFENSDNIVPNNLESYRSRNSLSLIESMLAEVEHIYFTSDTNISSLVNNIDNTNQISIQIQDKFNTLEQEIATFNNNLYSAITTNPESVRPIYNNLKELSVLFSVDVTSILSVTVLPTDNDGD